MGQATDSFGGKSEKAANAQNLGSMKGATVPNVFVRERIQITPGIPKAASNGLTGAETKLSNLPPFPAAATKLLGLLQNEEADLRLIKPVLASDPALAAELMRMANSPLFNVTNTIRNVEHAVALLGLDRITNLAVSIALRRYSAGTSDGAYKICWEHSLACAAVSEELADLYYVSKDDAYTAGLLHDIGRIGLLKAYSREYLPVLRAEYHSFNESLVVEHQVLKTTHCHSGSFLEKVWGFPPALQLVAESHHSAEAANEPQLARLIRVACAITEALGFPEVNCTNQPGLDSAALLLNGLAEDQITKRLSATKRRIDEKLAYF